MTKLKMHYDGWLALPATMRRRLGLATGDQLRAELVEGGVLLRTNGTAPDAIAPEAEEASTKPKAETTAAPSAPEPERKPRKATARPSSKLGVPSIPKARGRRKTKEE